MLDLLDSPMYEIERVTQSGSGFVIGKDLFRLGDSTVDTQIYEQKSIRDKQSKIVD